MTTTTDTQTTRSGMTFELRITNVLLAGGFTGGTRFTPAGKPAFHVSEGVGATVALCWDASSEERSLMLAKYENRLADNGLTVENRGRYLYVRDPASAVE